ncbi:unnamed protein product, partial [Rangifer tarandus platyrhynchus]
MDVDLEEYAPDPSVYTVRLIVYLQTEVGSTLDHVASNEHATASSKRRLRMLLLLPENERPVFSGDFEYA